MTPQIKIITAGGVGFLVSRFYLGKDNMTSIAIGATVSTLFAVVTAKE